MPTQEEIDIFLIPDDLIPPGVEDADSEDEVNESLILNQQDDRLNPNFKNPLVFAANSGALEFLIPLCEISLGIFNILSVLSINELYLCLLNNGLRFS
ncbi:hypothetical protein Tco_0654248 [Tanacetum coccineum]|uniref:Uncharacterized protein n=1 Tax=Tanacetum coccineum TaxID=301880 RepID=A0ABQ4X2N0_9ASTR